MNELKGYAQAVTKGWWAMLRLPRDGSARPLLGKGGEPQVFATELEAVKAVNRHLLAYVNGGYRHSGHRAKAHRQAANALFSIPKRPGHA
ncbi:hypothetical protein NAC44_15755 [Allorhizobium sp. BGMRC 0089]|uniref:hypothetical protein n=1 Tax=Allorhizobium sonneratiae TaxID=2934936 RepID=UPI002033AB88|nr:hypothetical protein [Allorhizobium sonneratiae]MCM2293782.1 hypothetical protein [Allorhizobium sonneratiae]